MITMLKVTNFRAIGQPIEMHLTRGGTTDTGTPSAAVGIWGPQGAGKSTIIDALQILRDAANGGEPWRLSPIPVEPHGTRSPADTPTTVGVDISRNRRAFWYELETTADAIARETLRVGARDILDRTAQGTTYGDPQNPDPGEPEPVTETWSDGDHNRDRIALVGSGRVLRRPKAAEFSEALKRTRIVRPHRASAYDTELTLKLCTADGDGNIGWKRRLAAGLLVNAGIDASDAEEHGSKTVRASADRAGDGARRILAIAGHAATILVEGGLLAVDPLDCGIHANWCRQLIDTFTGQPTAIDDRAQLLFTANSTTGLTALDPEDVWLMEPHLDGSSLHSLGDFKDLGEDDASIECRYQIGRFGGIPESTPFELQNARDGIYSRRRRDTD